jgi:hypothetical protein
MPRAPHGVRTHAAERVNSPVFPRAGRNGYDHIQELPAMTLRLFRKFVIDCISILGAFPLQEFKGLLPDFSAALVQARDNAARQRSLPEAFAPFSNLCVGGRHCHPL